MKLIVLTSEKNTRLEQVHIKKMLQIPAVYRVHIRKKGWTDKAMYHYVRFFTPAERERLMLHSNYSVVFDYGVGGVHMTGRVPLQERKLLQNKCLEYGRESSIACHKLSEVVAASGHYSLLSPIFNSISKPLSGKFDLTALQSVLSALDKPVFALGGITPLSAQRALRAGFTGVASLGYVWSANDPVSQVRELLSGASVDETMCA